MSPSPFRALVHSFALLVSFYVAQREFPRPLTPGLVPAAAVTLSVVSGVACAASLEAPGVACELVACAASRGAKRLEPRPPRS